MFRSVPSHMEVVSRMATCAQRYIIFFLSSIFAIYVRPMLRLILTKCTFSSTCPTVVFFDPDMDTRIAHIVTLPTRVQFFRKGVTFAGVRAEARGLRTICVYYECAFTIFTCLADSFREMLVNFFSVRAFPQGLACASTKMLGFTHFARVNIHRLFACSARHKFSLFCTIPRHTYIMPYLRLTFN